MKRRLLAAALAAIVVSCSPSGMRSQTETYTDDQLGFQFRYPADWKEIKAGGSAKVMFGEGQNRQIIVADELGGEKEIAKALEQFRKSVPDYKELKGGWVKFRGQRAYLQTISWNAPFGDNKAVRLYVPTGVHFFVVTAMTPVAEFDRYASLLQECVLSFELRK